MSKTLLFVDLLENLLVIVNEIDRFSFLSYTDCLIIPQIIPIPFSQTTDANNVTLRSLKILQREM